MSERKITVELEDGYKFEVDPSVTVDAGTEARGLLADMSVSETREGGGFTLYPIHRVKAIHVGGAPDGR